MIQKYYCNFNIVVPHTERDYLLNEIKVMHKDGDMALISTNVCLYNILKEWKIFVQKVYCKFLCEFTAILCKQL